MSYLRSLTLLMMLVASPLARAGIIQEVTASAEDIPLGGKLTIFFRLSQPATDVKVSMLDCDLKLVKAYNLGARAAGSHRVEWDTTDASGAQVAPEAYTWRIEATGVAGVRNSELGARRSAPPTPNSQLPTPDSQFLTPTPDTWEPSGLHSRPIEAVADYQWDPETGVISYRAAAPMRMWVRIGFALGACMRTLAEGEPRPGGVIAESWDGFDETGQINLLDRPDRVVAIFGYRLPQPCVIVSGAGGLPEPRFGREPPPLAPPLRVEDPVWARRRLFTLADRSRPRLGIVQLGPDTFAAALSAPATLAGQQSEILERALADRVRLKWFIDGHCAAEDVDGALPSLLTLRPDQIPKDGEHHFITANLMTVTHEVFTTSIWISPKEAQQ